MLAANDQKRSSAAYSEALLLDMTTAARLLSLSRTELYREMARGRMRSCTVGRRRLISRMELDRYVAARYADASAGE